MMTPTRRNLLRTIGGIGTVGAVGAGGLHALSGPSSAAAVNINASAPGSISNDRGDIATVTIDPSFRVEWTNLDDAVGKLFYLIEAAPEDAAGRTPFEGGYTGPGFSPVFRATPWLGSPVSNNHLDVSKPGTTGHYEIVSTHTQALNLDPRFSDGNGPDASAHPLVVADETGKPDYSSFDFSGVSGVDLGSYLDGTSLGSASNYSDSAVIGSEVVQNNFPDIDAGYYGAAMGTDALDNDADGTQQNTTLYLRYTFELQRPNESQVGDLSNLGSGVWEHVQESDVNTVGESGNTQGNSEIVMNGEDGNYGFSTPSGIPYDDLQAHPDHIGILVATAAFNVNVRNEESSSSVTGSSNTGASGTSQ
jgi:hypothetical protein